MTGSPAHNPSLPSGALTLDYQLLCYVFLMLSNAGVSSDLIAHFLSTSTHVILSYTHSVEPLVQYRIRMLLYKCLLTGG